MIRFVVSLDTAHEAGFDDLEPAALDWVASVFRAGGLRAIVQDGTRALTTRDSSAWRELVDVQVAEVPDVDVSEAVVELFRSYAFDDIDFDQARDAILALFAYNPKGS